jgi:hypothetical protein
MLLAAVWFALTALVMAIASVVVAVLWFPDPQLQIGTGLPLHGSVTGWIASSLLSVGVLWGMALILLLLPLLYVWMKKREAKPTAAVFDAEKNHLLVQEQRRSIQQLEQKIATLEIALEKALLP